MHTESYEMTLAASGCAVPALLEGAPPVASDVAPTLPVVASTGHLAAKRAFDIVAASILLVVVAPLLLVAAIGVRDSSPGPIFFRQVRIGRLGRPFTMLKFRTFPVDHDDTELAIPVDQCPLRWGRFLRRTSIDELPQLVNVLKGDMSLVGPRPERTQFASSLASVHPDYRERHRMPVGITGLAQVMGLVGTTSIEDRTAADNAYIEGWTFGRDLSILLRTVPAVIRKFR